MLASVIINRARRALQDTVATYRWSDAILIDYLNEAIDEASALRPDITLDDEGAMTAITTVAAVGENIDLEDNLTAPLADYVAYRAFEQDNTDTHNAERAAWHLARFMAAMTGGQA